MVKVALICPCWSGWRRGEDDIYNRDRSIYLRVQLIQLTKMKHNIDKIIFVIPQNKEEPEIFRSYLQKIPSRIQNADVEILETKNTLSSYGPYNWVYEKYGNFFDYYILCEDDYVFVKDNFDKILLKYMERDNDLGYLCSKVGNCNDGSWIVSVSNGVVRATALEKIWKKHGYIPHDGQSSFSNAFYNLSIKTKDIGNRYRVPFYGFGTCAWFYNCNDMDLIVPVQVFLNYKDFREVFLPSSWPEWKNLTYPIELITDTEKYEEKFLKGCYASTNGF